MGFGTQRQRLSAKLHGECRKSPLQAAARIAFIAAAIFAFVMAVTPHPPRIPGEPSDKALHILAFVTLGGLAAFGFRGVSLMRLFLTLTLLGAIIELVQAIPALNRNSEIADLLADMAAALMALTVTRWLIAVGARRGN